MVKDPNSASATELARLKERVKKLEAKQEKSLRNKLAGMAMQGLLASLKESDFKGGDVQMNAHVIVKSVEMADALIAQLNKD